MSIKSADKSELSLINLGVMLNSELSMKQHIAKVTSTYFYQLMLLRQMRLLVGQEITAQLLHAFVLSRVDYSVLAGLPKSSIASLQRVQNAAARPQLVLDQNMCDPVTLALRQLHWRPGHLHVDFKLCTLMYAVHTGQCPKYLSGTIHAAADNPTRIWLRLVDTALYRKPRCYSPPAWNALPSELHDSRQEPVPKTT